MHRTRSRRKYVWAGRRAGKGRSAIYEALAAIEVASKTPLVDQQDGTDVTYTLEPPIHVWSVGPTLAQLRQVWNEMKAYIPEHLVRNEKDRSGRNTSGWKNDDMTVWLDLKDEYGNWLPGRVRHSVFWELKTADNPETLQTVGLDFLHIAESQDVKLGAWQKVEPVLNSPGRLGRAVLEGIPPLSKAHWFSRLFWAGLDNPTHHETSFRATTFDNTLLTSEQIEDINSLRDKIPESVWKRHYLAEQPESGGGFFRKIERAARAVPLLHPEKGRRYVAGLDLGRSQDPTVLVIKDRQTRQSVYGLELLRHSWEVQKEVIQNETRHWNVEEIRMDATAMGGDVMFEEFSNMGLPVVPYRFTSNDKYQLFVAYAVALENETVSFPAEWDRLRRQLESIEAVKSGNTAYVFRTVDESHDDWVDAETLALMACDPATIEGQSLVVPTRQTVRPVNGDGPAQRAWVGPGVRARRAARYENIPDILVNGEPVRLTENGHISSDDSAPEHVPRP